VFSGEEDSTIPVRVLPSDFHRLWRRERWVTLCESYGVKVSGKERANLLSLVQLSHAVQTGRFRIYTQHDAQRRPRLKFEAAADLDIYVKLQSAIRARERSPIPSCPPDKWNDKAVQAKEVWRQLVPTTGGHPLAALVQQLGSRVKSGSLVLWWSRREEKLRAGLYFSQMQDAIYALLALQTGEPEGVGICERCGKVFKRSRLAQKFCSLKCGNYVRKKRERAKQH
jgi:hypothetical protein